MSASDSGRNLSVPSFPRFLLLAVGLVLSAAGVVWYVAWSTGEAYSPTAAPGSGPAGIAEVDSGRNAGEASASRTPRFPDDPASIEGRLRESVEYLASDELQGRGVRTRGLDRAAEYIAEEFDQAGLRTDLYNDGPFQKFRLSSRLGLGGTNEMQLKGPEGEAAELAVGEDFTPLSLSGSGTFDLPLAFVGYGITAPEVGYDDYAGLDVAGKAVVVLRHEPRRDDPESVFNGTDHSEHAYFVRKVTNAVEHGAEAVILCTDRHEIVRLRAENGQNSEDVDPLLEFQVRTRIADRRIPVVHCRRAPVDRVLKSALGEGLAALERRIDEQMTPQSSRLAGWRVAGTVSVVQKGRSLKNVVGLLEGEGPRWRQTIVLGGHYDHLGRGGWGSLALGADNEIHNGADDNASGTAVVLEAARRLASRERPLPRSVLFVAFSAEEMGLIGSRHYVRNPAVPLENTIAMINLDMVGRLRKDRLTVYGTGTAAEFDPLIARLGGKHGLRLSTRPGGYGPSDHANFYGRGVPVLHFFTGFHSDYHRPSDDFDKLNYAGMTRISRLVTDLVVQLAKADRRPRQTEASDFAALLGSSEPESEDDADRPARAYLGVVGEQESGGEAGFTVARVVDGSPADEHGLRAGDVILRFADGAIERPGELRELIAAREPDERVALEIRRGAVEFELQVTLGARR